MLLNPFELEFDELMDLNMKEESGNPDYPNK